MDQNQDIATNMIKTHYHTHIQIHEDFNQF